MVRARPAPAATGTAQRSLLRRGVTGGRPLLELSAHSPNTQMCDSSAHPPEPRRATSDHRAPSLLLPRAAEASELLRALLEIQEFPSEPNGTVRLKFPFETPYLSRSRADLFPQESTSTTFKQTWKVPKIQRMRPCIFLNTSLDRKQPSPLNDLENGGFGNCTDSWFIEHPQDTDF